MSVETLKETITEFIKDKKEVVSYDLFHGEFKMEKSSRDDEKRTAFRAKLVDLGLQMNLEARYGGEGEGDDYWSVYSVTNGEDTVYMRFQGWYASYHGSEFTEWFFVEPKEKTIVVFE